LDAAHLRMPWLVETGLAMRSALPGLANVPLPRSRAEMVAQVLRLGSVPIVAS